MPNKDQTATLKGWKEHLGQPVSVAQRWSKEGMPVNKKGRFVYAVPEKLTEWVGADAGKVKPVRIASEEEDLAQDLKQGLAYVKRQRK